ARPVDVRRLVLMQGMRPTLVGIGVGLIAAAAIAGLLRSLLFGVTPADPLTFSLVPPLLLAVAALACYLPAMRATRLDPTVALRSEWAAGGARRVPAIGQNSRRADPRALGRRAVPRATAPRPGTTGSRPASP